MRNLSSDGTYGTDKDTNLARLESRLGLKRYLDHHMGRRVFHVSFQAIPPNELPVAAATLPTFLLQSAVYHARASHANMQEPDPGSQCLLVSSQKAD